MSTRCPTCEQRIRHWTDHTPECPEPTEYPRRVAESLPEGPERERLLRVAAERSR